MCQKCGRRNVLQRTVCAYCSQARLSGTEKGQAGGGGGSSNGAPPPSSSSTRPGSGSGPRPSQNDSAEGPKGHGSGGSTGGFTRKGYSGAEWGYTTPSVTKFGRDRSRSGPRCSGPYRPTGTKRPPEPVVASEEAWGSGPGWRGAEARPPRLSPGHRGDPAGKGFGKAVRVFPVRPRKRRAGFLSAREDASEDEGSRNWQEMLEGAPSPAARGSYEPGRGQVARGAPARKAGASARLFYGSGQVGQFRIVCEERKVRCCWPG